MAAAALSKNFYVNVTINVKRGKEEIEFAKTETDRLHNLISNQVETDWAKGRIEALHQMIFMPPAEQIAKDIQDKLNTEDNG